MKRLHSLRIDIFLKVIVLCCMFLGQLLSTPTISNAQESNCYISDFAVKVEKDGTATFDDNDDVGNDSNDHNKIVRSFDYINYDLEYVTAISNPSEVVDSAYVYIEFSLDKDPSEAVFNKDTFLWCENAKTTYYYEDGTSSTNWDKNKPVAKQVLTGKRKITNNAEINAIPGVGTLSFGIYVKGAKNNDIIQPTFKCWIEGNDESLVKECQGSPIKVSAAPRYNVSFVRNSTSGNADPLMYVSQDLTKYSSESQEGWLKGRMEGYSIRVELYNDNANKGLKGIELPKGDITFDIVVSEEVNGKDMTDTPEYTPYLWDWSLNDPGTSKKGINGKDMCFFGDSYTSSNYAVPYGRSDYFKKSHNITWDSGAYKIVDNGDHTYSVTLKGYSFDIDQYFFPYAHIHGTNQTYTYGENIGIFSVGLVQFLCQFPEEVDTTSNLLMKAKVENFNFNSISDQNAKSDMVAKDNEANTNITLYPRGSYSSRDVFGGSSTYGRGDASIALGDKKQLSMSFSYYGDQPLTSWNFLQKFDDTRFELVSNISINHKGNRNNVAGDVTILYAAKPDKTGWKNDEEQNSAKEENLIYFKSLDELKIKGYTCVGFLVETRNGKYYSTDGCVSLSAYFKAKEDAEAGTVGMFKESSRAWRDNVDVMSWTEVQYDGNSDIYGLGSSETNWESGGKYYEGYTKPKYNHNISYKKTTYNEGTVSGGHTGGYLAGNSLLLVGDVTSIKVQTKDGKTSYDMDNNERTVTYVLSPTLKIASKNLETQETNLTDNVYITTTLPKDLKYKPGSASVEPSEVTESNGKTIIKWVLPNLKVGEPIDKITFDASIGKAGTKDDVQNMQQILISAKISSDLDTRQQIISSGNVSETSINIIKLATSSISKSVDKEYQETGSAFTYSLNVGNTSEISMDNVRMYDVLPFNKDGRGTNFSGNYRVDKVTLKFEDSPKTYENVKNNVSLKVTNDKSYRESDKSKNTLINKELGNWSSITSKQVNDEKKEVTFTLDNTDITAMYFDIGGNLEGNEFITVDLKCTPLDKEGNYLKDTDNHIQQSGDIYVNSFYQYADNQIAIVQSNIAKTQVVRRSLSGLVWVDDNKNGIQDTNEVKIKDKTVSLYRSDVSKYGDENTYKVIGMTKLYPAYTSNGKKVESVTLDSNGKYKFDDLESGTYSVVLDDVSPYTVTSKNTGGNTEIDNDATQGEMNGDKMLSAIVSEVTLPSIEGMTSATYESKFNDFGLYRVLVSPVTFEKVWNDDNNRDALRPESISFTVKGGNITKNYTLSADENWEKTVTDLPKYDDNGNVITYTVTEDETKGYKSSVSGNLDSGYTLTNTHEIETVEVEVQKEWNDGSDRDGVRSDSIGVKLLANGKDANKTLILNKENNWKSSFSYLPKNENGKEIAYTVEEESTPKGYTSTVNRLENGMFVVTNTHNVETKNITVNKKWVDDNNRDGIRPDSVEVQLYGNGKVVDTAILNEANGWKHVFENVFVNENGEEIEYEVKEKEVTGYTASIEETSEDNWTVTNTHDVLLTNVTVNKEWVDKNNQDGVRPNSVEISLYGNDKLLETVELNKGNNWEHVFENVYVNEKGKEIKYDVREKEVPKYTTNIKKTDGSNKWTVTNTHDVYVKDVTVSKEWDDMDNRDGIRPNEVEVELYANGDLVDTTVLNESNNWKYVFKNLEVNKEQKEIEYTVKEKSIKGYKDEVKEVKDDEWVITNKHDVELTSVSVNKVWSDKDNQDGIRPESVTVELLANGEVLDTAVLNETNDWKHEFTKLYVNEQGKKIDYTVREKSVEEYTDTITNKEGTNEWTITNSHDVYLKDISVSKVWEDKDNQDGIRPDSVTVELLADGEVVRTAMLSDKNDWKYTFKGMEVNKNQKEVKYEIREKEVPEYTTSIDEVSKDNWVVTNTHSVYLKDITVNKVWNDKDNQDGIRPESITIQLLGNSNLVAEATLDESNDWSYVFKDLEVNSNGEEIVYEVKEFEVEGYETSITEKEENTFEITNSHDVLLTDLKVNKVWDDEDDKDGIRPDSVEVELYANDELVGEVSLSEDNNWEYVFEGLDVFKNQKEIEYSVKEKEVKGYEPTIEHEEGTYDWTITNKHTVKVIPKDTETGTSLPMAIPILAVSFILILVISLVIYFKKK